MLKDLLYKVKIVAVKGNTNVEINALQLDSRSVKEQNCFIAVNGTQSNGHDYINAAIENGAVAIICEALPAEIKNNITYVQVENSAIAAGIISNNFYGEPSAKIKLVGVTGTNGKTTIATLLFQLFSKLGYKCGLISTVQNQVGNNVIPATHTTPDAVNLNALLSQMADAGCTYVFMECSSHAIQQHRLTGLVFTGAIFSNITHDHLDYHKTFDEYIRVKKSWFDELPKTAFAISNADDKRGTVMLQNTIAKKYFYSLKTLADYKGKILENSFTGLHMLVNETEVNFKMIGEFNAYNLLAVYAAAICLGQDKQEVLLQLSNLNGAEGRFDYVISPNKIIGIVDYAHTPDALQNVLSAITDLANGTEKVITIIGCGGDRDKTKRPLMAKTACEWSNKVILTTDNPRSESPEKIIEEMMIGVSPVNQKKVICITDRKEAIKTACHIAQAGDIILLAGKGHEKYQEIMGVKSDFDDKKILMEQFNLLG
jgi:UDP-N-acetylmuramoyl-L-alanyl-D-glutamate--2,6-diaminopimelate ligase